MNARTRRTIVVMQDVQRLNDMISFSLSLSRIVKRNTSPFGCSQKSQAGFSAGTTDIRLVMQAAWNILYVDAIGGTCHIRAAYEREPKSKTIQGNARGHGPQSSGSGSILGREHPNGGTLGAWSHKNPTRCCVGISGTGLDAQVRAWEEVIMSTKKKSLHPAIEQLLAILGKEGRPDSASKLPQTISYQTLRPEAPSTDGTFCAPPKRVKKRKEVKSTRLTISPVSNVPSEPTRTEDDVFDPRTVLAYRLRNELQHRELQMRDLLYKMSRALEVIVSTEQFFNDGMHRDQWETYDQLMRRRARLKAVREMIMSAGSLHSLSPEDEMELRKKLGME